MRCTDPKESSTRTGVPILALHRLTVRLGSSQPENACPSWSVCLPGWVASPSSARLQTKKKIRQILWKSASKWNHHGAQQSQP